MRYGLALRRKRAEFPESGYFGYIAGVRDPDLDSTILIEIPSYMDPELVPTVRAALASAANPGRVRFAICLQDDDQEALAILRNTPGCRVKHIPAADAPGTCAARYEASLLRSGEDYVLHTDGHMRFASFWDVACIDQYRRCPGRKKILTDYCANYNLTDGAHQAWADAHASVGGRYIRFSYFQQGSHKPRYTAKTPFQGPGPAMGQFACAHFLFSEARLDDDVPVDPDTFFVGDECMFSLRAWTSGYDIYHSGVRFAYHLYGRADAAKAVGAAPPPRFAGNGATDSRRASENLRLEQLFGVRDHGIAMGRFGVGTRRSREDYYRFAGADYASRTVRRFAYDGSGHGPQTGSAMAPACAAGLMVTGDGNPFRGLDLSMEPEKRIHVIVTACRCGGELATTVDSLFRNADTPGRVSVDVIAQDVDEGLCRQCRELGARAIPCPCKGVGNAQRLGEDFIPDDADYVLYSEEHMYYVKGWDTAMACSAMYCGDRFAISDWAPQIDYSNLPADPAHGIVTGASGVMRCGHILIRPDRPVRGGAPVRGAFIIGHNLLVPAAVARELKHDPEMWMNTNESYMTYRYWCAGVDLYHSPIRTAYHRYERGRSGGHANEVERSFSRPRMQFLLGIPGGDPDADKSYALGTARTLQAFARFSGVDPIAGTVNARAFGCLFCDDLGAAAHVPDGHAARLSEAVERAVDNAAAAAVSPARVCGMDRQALLNGFGDCRLNVSDGSHVDIRRGALSFGPDGKLFVGSGADLCIEDGGMLIVMGKWNMFPSAAIRVRSAGILILGDGYCNSLSLIDCHHRIELTSCIIAPGACVTDRAACRMAGPDGALLRSVSPVRTGGHNWIGFGCYAGPGTSFGRDCVLGASTTSPLSVPDGTIVTDRSSTGNITWR